MLWREASSSRSTNPVQFEGETSLPSEEPGSMYLYKAYKFNIQSNCICVDWLGGFIISLISLINAATDLQMVCKCKTSHNGGLLRSQVGIVCPCRVCASWGRKVAPGLPQGGVDPRDWARILHFTLETGWRNLFLTRQSLKHFIPCFLLRFNSAGNGKCQLTHITKAEHQHIPSSFSHSPTASGNLAVSQIHDTGTADADQKSVLPKVEQVYKVYTFENILTKNCIWKFVGLLTLAHLQKLLIHICAYE